MLKNKKDLWAKIQAFLLVVAFALPFLLRNINIDITFQNEQDWIVIDISKAGLPVWVSLLATGILLSGLLCHLFRQENKEVMFNTGNGYKDFWFWWYSFCAAILGYKKCDLRGVPIPTIARLIVNDTFEEYYCGDINELKENEIINVETIWLNGKEPDEHTTEINLIVEDTFVIEKEVADLIISNKNLPTLKISRDRMKRGRWYVSEFAEEIWEVLHKNTLRNVVKVNLYATTNPKNTKDIVEKVFRAYGRGNVETLEVFQQKCDAKRAFEKRGVKILLKVFRRKF